MFVCSTTNIGRKRLVAIAKVDLVVIEDYVIAPLGPRERHDLLELLDDRVGGRSTLITSQIPLDHWQDYIGGTLAVDTP